MRLPRGYKAQVVGQRFLQTMYTTDQLRKAIEKEREDGLERFAELVAAAERNKIATWMMAKGYATGHGDTVENLLEELECQVKEGEREACAAIARQWDVDHPTTNYGGCIANEILKRGQA